MYGTFKEMMLGLLWLAISIFIIALILSGLVMYFGNDNRSDVINALARQEGLTLISQGLVIIVSVVIIKQLIKIARNTAPKPTADVSAKSE